jgi:lambda family phage portal protein
MSTTEPTSNLPAVIDPAGFVKVPLIQGRMAHQRPEMTMGYLDRHPDSARPPLSVAPYLRSADEEVRRAWAPVTGHARHLLTTSGFLAYGVELSCAWTVGGAGLLPNITPDADALGWDAGFAKTWARAVENHFANWGNDPLSCDAQGRMKFGQMQSAALKSWFASGDILSVLDFEAKRGASWKSALSLIDPTRLMTPYLWQTGTIGIQDGIEFDKRGRPLAYHIRPLPGQTETVRIPSFGSHNKRLALHVFDGDVGTVRGISPLGTAIGGILQSQNMADAAVLSAHIAAMVVGVITSDLPSDVVAKSIGGNDPQNVLTTMMTNRIEWHEGLKKAGAHLQLGHGARVVHLSSGERFDLLAGKNAFSDHKNIIDMGLREAARALGLSYEHITGDKSGNSYSSIKVAISEAYSIVEQRRKRLIEPLCEFALTSIVEEAVADGTLPFPRRQYLNSLEAFRAQKHLALKTAWRGPAAPAPDELRAARAAQLRIQSGLTSLSDEIAALGGDAETTFTQRQHDEEMLRERKLTLPWPVEQRGK